MVNIIFMLLFFFVVAGTVQQADPLSIDIPNAKSDSAVDGSHALVLLGRGGKLSFEGMPITEDQLPKSLKASLLRNRDLMITIRVDEHLPARSLTKLIGIIQNAGGENIALEVET